MDYQKHLEQCAARRKKILAFISTGKTFGQAALKFGVTRQRIQQIATPKKRKNGR